MCEVKSVQLFNVNADSFGLSLWLIRKEWIQIAK